jgi:hypothetical protein
VGKFVGFAVGIFEGMKEIEGWPVGRFVGSFVGTEDVVGDAVVEIKGAFSQMKSMMWLFEVATKKVSFHRPVSPRM